VQAYFTLVAVLGTAGYGAREIARARDDKALYSKLFWEIELLSVLTSSICILAWGILVLTTQQYRMIFLIMTLNLFAKMLNIEWLFRGLEQFKQIVIRNTFFKLLGIAMIFLFVKTPNDLTLYITILALSEFLSSLTLWSYLPAMVEKVPLKELHILRHFRSTLVYFVPTIATTIYTVLDKTLIGVITHANAENGVYEQAEKIINMAKSVSFSALDSVMGVRISYLFAMNRLDEIHRRIENSLHYIFFMSFGCMFGIIGVAKNFVPLFFGEGYDKVVPLLYIFAPIIVIVGVSTCLGGHYYTPSGRRAASARILVLGAGINVVLNLLLIPRSGILGGAIGAAIASVLAEGIITLLYVRFSNGFCTWSLLVHTGSKKLLAGIVMCVFVALLGEYLPFTPVVTLLLQVALGAALYGVLLLLLRDVWLIEMLQKMYKRVRRV
jgi:O-antigen/teichoic acid export membrane protein